MCSGQAMINGFVTFTHAGSKTDTSIPLCLLSLVLTLTPPTTTTFLATGHRPAARAARTAAAAPRPGHMCCSPTGPCRRRGHTTMSAPSGPSSTRLPSYIRSSTARWFTIQSLRIVKATSRLSEGTTTTFQWDGRRGWVDQYGEEVDAEDIGLPFSIETKGNYEVPNN